MNVAREFEAQWSGFERAFREDRLAHAYTVIGAPRTDGQAFAMAALHLLFDAAQQPAVAGRIAQRTHPDIVWLEPQSKSRRIRVEDIRLLNQRMGQTASEGGWKVGILLYADCLNEQASNAFLKTLEEPVGRTLFLLLTEAPQALLTTIHSRCQHLVLSRGESRALTGEWRERVVDLLTQFEGQTPMQVFVASDQMKALLADIKSSIETDLKQGEDETNDQYAARVEAALREVQADVLRAILYWQRDLLVLVSGSESSAPLYFPEQSDILERQAQQIDLRISLRRIEAVEQMAQRLSRSVPVSVALDAGFAGQLGRRRPA